MRANISKSTESGARGNEDRQSRCDVECCGERSPDVATRRGATCERRVTRIGSLWHKPRAESGQEEDIERVADKAQKECETNLANSVLTDMLTGENAHGSDDSAHA